MSKELQNLLHELKNRGNTVLGDEVAAFLEATQDEHPSTALPYARRMLAQAAKTLREGTKDDVAIAHDFLGASIEVFKEEKAGETPSIPDAVTATLGRELAPEHAFKKVEKVMVEGDSPDFNNASEELVTVLANLLLDGGYVEEARRYLTEYNLMNEERNTIVATKTKKTLKELQAQYRKNGDLVRARALEEVISDLDADEELDDEAASAKDMEDDDEGKACMSEEGKEETEEESKAADDKPVLQVDPASDEECKEKEEAQAALAKGNIKLAKKHLSKAAKMERMRLTAALIRVGDMELAMAGLVEAEGEEDVPADEKCGGYKQPVQDDAEEDEADGKEECKEDAVDEKPSEAEMEKREEDADEEVDEKEVAQAIARHVRKSVKAGNLKAAKEGLKDLSDLEKAIVAGIKKAEDQIKDMALAKEGYDLWKQVRAVNLKAIKVVAEEEGDDEKADKATEGLDELKKDEEAPIATDVPPVANDDMLNVKEGDLKDSLDSEPSEDEEKPEDEEKEADAMKYECLQSLEDLKNMNVDRNALAFTFWESKEDPFWTIQASGKPIAEVHLADQTDPEDVSTFFCDQTRWPNVIAQTTEKVGLYTMLKGVKARFYAHGVTKSALAKSLKTEVEASLKDLRAERLGTLRADFVDSMVCAADALNKGLIAGKSNPLKRAFVDKLASLGFSNPALVVEECFASSFRPYLDQIIADAQEYLEMPKEAFAHTKKMISSAANVAVAQASQFSDETLSERLSRRSMPLAHSEEAHDAPAEVDAALRNMSANEKHNDMKRRLRLGMKY